MDDQVKGEKKVNSAISYEQILLMEYITKTVA